MEGISATTATPTMDATTPGMDVSTPNTISPAVLNEAVSENVKNIKRKVISVSKLMEIFKNKESEMDAVKKELETAKAQVISLQKAAAKVPPLVPAPAINSNEVEELKAEAELTKTKLKESEAQISKLSQSLRSQQMLNHQLEEKTHGQERLNAEVLDLQKKLSLATKNLEQANRKRISETTSLRERLMKATADITDKATWLAENRKKWQQEEESRKSKRESELESQVEELQSRLEDIATERYLDSELAKEEVKKAEEKQQRMTKKADELQEKQKVLTKTILDLRSEKAELERRLEDHGTEEFMELGGEDDFEEVIPKQGASQQTPLHKPVEAAKSPILSKVSKPALPPSPTTPVQLTPEKLSKLQLDTALESLDQLKVQFSMLRWIGGNKDDKTRITALEEQVKTLSKERSALQEALTRQLAIPTPLPLTPTTANTIMVAAPTANDTIARIEPMTKKGKKRRVEEVEELAMDVDDDVPGFDDYQEDDAARGDETMLDDQAASGSSTVSTTTAQVESGSLSAPETPARRKPGRPKKNPDAAPEPPKQKRKYTKRETKASTSTTDFSQVEIRNISVNPFTPSITNPVAYFSTLMNAPIAHDSQAHTKLDIIATILPAKLDALFEAVQKKIPDIAGVVKQFRKKANFNNHKLEVYSLDGFDDISISKNVSEAEISIAVLLCLLGTKFPQMGIISKFFSFAYDSIMHGATKEDQRENASIMLRILTAVCRAKDDAQTVQVLAYDILRETTTPTTTLFLSESIASVWPSIYVIPVDAKDEDDPRRLMFITFQAVLGSLQAGTAEGTKNYFALFTKRCGWPVFDAAPYMDEVMKSIMDTVLAEDFAEKCNSTPGLEFTIRKALELLLIYGYDWDELYNDVIKPTLFKQILDPTLHTFALPLIASVVREARCKPLDLEDEEKTNKATRPVQQMLNAILKADASLSHQAQSALAIVALSNGQREQLEELGRWYEGLDQDERVSMPQVLRDVLA
ncbi:hypothetical protein BGZ95_003384 [Linnemannia exigua]|uniref:Uncharacterized protein n=1 Tax=Linnemannia exigua TaxID=604196 RepID=A0AAD4D4R5_9FUNG|nr:hypothetical protein BGZ95_003384 [Linnemannia exigua]